MSVDSPSSGATSALPDPSAPDRVRSSPSVGRSIEPALPLGDRAHEDRIVEGRPDRLHDLDRVAGPDLAAQHVVALVPRQQPDLGDVGPEHLAGVVEQRDERRIELRAALEDPRRLVQQLDALVLLTLRDVRPVGERGGDRRQRANSQIDSGFAHRTVSAISARLAFVSETTIADLEHLRDPPVLRRSPRPARSRC